MKIADPGTAFAISHLDSVGANIESMMGLQLAGTAFGIFPYNTTGGAGFIHISTGDTDVLLDNTYNHFAITWISSDSSTKIHVNGVSKGITQENGFTTSPRINGIINFGRRRNNTQFYGGLMDEIGLWSKELTSTEITDLYNGGSGQTMIEAVAEVELTIPVVWW